MRSGPIRAALTSPAILAILLAGHGCAARHHHRTPLAAWRARLPEPISTRADGQPPRAEHATPPLDHLTGRPHYNRLLSEGWPVTRDRTRTNLRDDRSITREIGWLHEVPSLGEFQLVTEQSTPAARRTPLPGFWETVRRDLRDWPRVFWEDTKDVFTNRQNLIILGLTYGASIAIQETGPDDAVEDSFRTHSTFKKGFRDAFSAIGNPGTHFGVAGLWYLLGQQTQDERAYDVSTKLFRALAVTGVTTFIGQTLAFDDSPNGEWGAFPSGHTASTFAFASVVHHEYGPLYGIPLYAVGGLVGWTRLEDHEHYLSDVVMGGVMGLVIGHTIANDGQPPTLFGGHLAPYVDPWMGASGIAWVKQFK